MLASLSDMPAPRKISVQLDGDLSARLRRSARERKVKEAALVREAIEKHLTLGADLGESAYDMAKRLGILGSVKGLPPDLATNPKYMEGFGESRRD
ncbi:MAG: CopG family transcriptional regulator [Bryobacteraceae bacterium]|nr:CopG family transcriptional regulator [Bryobacteraceae bacterium]